MSHIADNYTEYEPENNTSQQCVKCLEYFHTTLGAIKKYCNVCRKEVLAEHERSIRTKIKAPKIKGVTGNYVYAWMNNGAPFYIGRGVNTRYIDSHDDAPCQVLREEIGAAFSVAIIRSDLTIEGAILIESVLIDLYNPLCNLIRGNVRQEKPPLTLTVISQDMVCEENRLLSQPETSRDAS